MVVPPLRITTVVLIMLAAALLVPMAAALAQALPVEVQVQADSRQVTVGDRISLTVIVRYDESISLDLPGPGDDFGELKVLEAAPAEQRTLGDGRLETRLAFVLAAFRTGQLRVPPLEVSYTDAVGNRGTAASQALPITVESVIPLVEEPEDIRDLKPQLSIPGGTPVWVGPLSAAGGLAGVGLISAFAWWRLAHLRSRRRPSVPPPPPEEVARRELDRIASQGLVSKGDYRAHYRLLSACLRRYVSDRYRFPAFAFTTGELEEQMMCRGVDRWQARLVAALLRECDQVHYGQYRPATARAEADLTTAYEMLEVTRPEEVEEGEPALP